MADEIDDSVEMTESGQTHAQDQATHRQATAADRGIPDDPDEARRELEKARKALAAANKESAERRRKLEEFERREEEAKQEKLSETDRLKKIAAAERQKAADLEHRATAAEKALVDTRIAHAVEREAALAKFTYPDVAPSLVDRSLIEFDPETHEVRGADKAVAKLLKAKPGLAESHSGGGTPPRQGPRRAADPGGGGGQNANPNQPRGLTPQEELIAQGGYGF